jgi:hypothetical protein
VDVYWLIMPELHPQGVPLAWLWLDIAAVLLVVGACGLAVVWALARQPLYPVRDPRLHEALEVDHNHVAAQAPSS